MRMRTRRRILEERIKLWGRKVGVRLWGEWRSYCRGGKVGGVCGGSSRVT